MARKSKSSHSSMRDRMRERANTREQSGRGGVKFNFPEGQEIKFLKIDKAGTKKLDFLPYEVTTDKHPAGVEKGDLWYQRTIFTHNGIGPEEKSYLCLKTVGKKCPICDYAAQLQRDPKADEDLIKSLKAKEREIFNVIDLGGDSDEILFWEFSYHLFGKLLEEEIRNAEPEEDFKAAFADLEGGSTLKIRFDEKKMGKNTFYEAKRIDFLERDDYPESILDDVLNLDEVLNVLPYEKLEGIFLDTEPEEETPKRGSRGSKKKDDDEPEEKSSRRGDRDKKEEKSSRRSKKEEPEEVDLDDLDLDELKEFIEENDLDIEVKRKMDEDEVRDLIREALEEKEEKSSKKSDKRSSRGKKEEDDEPPRRGGRNKKDDDEPEEKSSRRGGSDKDDKKKKKKDDDDDCPGGGTFGEDEGEFDECIDCDKWDECKAASKAAKKKSRR